MFFAPTRILRIKAALVMVVLYAVCVLAPSAAFAFGDAIPFCLIEDTAGPHIHQHAAPVHVHADGTSHQHADGAAAGAHIASHQHADHGAVAQHSASHQHQHPGDHGNGNAGDCCGLFQITGFLSGTRIDFEPSSLAMRSGPYLTGILHGCDPAQINRPPIS